MQPITVIPAPQRRSFDDGGPRITENARGTAHPYGFAGRRARRDAPQAFSAGAAAGRGVPSQSRSWS
jgi:hypothetical protein